MAWQLMNRVQMSSCRLYLSFAVENSVGRGARVPHLGARDGQGRSEDNTSLRRVEMRSRGAEADDEFAVEGTMRARLERRQRKRM
jgi:hypothetical protein